MTQFATLPSLYSRAIDTVTAGLTRHERRDNQWQADALLEVRLRIPSFANSIEHDLGTWPDASPETASLERWLVAAENGVPREGRPVAIVCFRSPMWIEWSLYAACQLASLGHRPTLIFSGEEIDRVYRHEADGTLRIPGCMRWSMLDRSTAIRCLDLDPLMPNPEALSELEIAPTRRSAHIAAAHDLRIEAFDSPSDARHTSLAARLEKQFARTRLACASMLEGLKPYRAICPSGLVGWSPAFRAAATSTGTSTAFVEFWNIRPGHMISEFDRTAMDFDLAGKVARAGSWDDDKEGRVRELIEFRHDPRLRPEWLHDFHSAQHGASEQELPEAVTNFLRRSGRHIIMAPNVIGDSITLDRATIFRSQRDWIEATCGFVRSRPDLNLIVRAHPDEVRTGNCRVRTADLADAVAKGADNILVVRSEDTVNTYSIAERADLGLVWTSTIGVDMILDQKPVIVAAAAPYLKLGVGISATSTAEYFDLVGDVPRLSRATAARMLEAAKWYCWLVFFSMPTIAYAKEGFRSYRYLDRTLNAAHRGFYERLVEPHV
jgi:hypothetical protein